MNRRILAGIAMVLIIFSGSITPLFGFFSPEFKTPVANAQYDWGTGNGITPPSNLQPDNTTIGNNEGALENAPEQSSGTGQTITTTSQPTPEEKKAAEDAKAAAEADALKCGANPVCNTVKSISSLVMFPSFYFAALGGLFMDYVLWGTINSTSYSDGTDGNQSGLGGLAVAGWKLVRDITNILFIFALFVVAFNLILNRESATASGQVVAVNSFGMDPKRTFVRIILMALLVNFSFFIGRAIISIANVAAVTFFNKIDTPVSESNPSNTSEGGDISTLYGLNYFPGIKATSLAILSKSNPQALVLNTKSESGTHVSFFGTTLWGSYDWSTYILILCITGMVSLFNFFLCYIFFSIAILLLGRTMGLVMALIISPLAFVSFAIPSLEDKPYIGFSDWFSQFIGLAATAPIFIFFLYLVISSLKIGFASGSDAGFFATALFIMIKLSFTVGLLQIAKRVTKNLAGRVGQVATKVVTSVAVNAAIIGTAAATGGASAALLAARRQATQGAISMGQKVLGNERTEALQKRLGGLKNFRTLPSNPRDAALGLAGIVTGGSKVPGQINDGISLGQRYGAITNRAMNIKNIREERLAAEAAAAKKKSDDRVKYNYDARKAAQDLRDTQKAKGGTPATLGDGRAKAPDFTATQEDRIKRKLLANKEKIKTNAEKKKSDFRKKYNYDARKAAQDARTAAVTKNGINPVMGDGSAKAPSYTLTQQERILNKAIAAEAKRIPQGTPTAPVAQPTSPGGTNPPNNSIPPNNTTPPPNNPPSGGAVPPKPPIPPTPASQPQPQQSEAQPQTKAEPTTPKPDTITGGPQTTQTKVGQKVEPRAGQTEPMDGTTRPKNAFNGNVNFDRPANIEQKAESQKLAEQYRPATQNPVTQVENLTVKANNLTLEGGAKTLPVRNTNTPGSQAPRERAMNILTNLQMPPRAASSVSNYTSSTFAPKTEPVKPLDIQSTSAGKITDIYGKPLSSKDQKSDTEKQ